MKRVRTRLGRSAILCTVAGTALALTATPALADEISTLVYGDSGAYLGSGKWVSATSGANENGYISAYDAYCDGDNGIIGALYKQVSGSWQRTNLVSQRGCGQTNTTQIKPPPTGPAYGAYVRFRVCKLLPDGTWKDCQDKYGYNRYQ
ncbi:hypothetical protein [Actinomadura alba]|uniref:Secreted protein n=1 Tax=Actinomadura alba TaxID=406431 RepID=A0ABR7LHI9_9ACTN|nr:hypothetical protein [Actinomadura alba]MBC6463960.1 hypothetical protein [Actinomadura alba]